MSAISILGLIIAITSVVYAEPECHLTKLMKCDDIAVDALNSLPKKSIPHTEEEVSDMCSQVEDALSCAAKFRESCMTPMQKEVIKYLTEGVVVSQKEICNPGSEFHKRYLEHAECLNQVSHMEEVSDAMKYILAVMEKAETVETNQRLVYSCCAYAHIFSTFLKLGRNECGKDATDAVEDIISLGIAQLPEVVCSGFDEDNAKCLEVLPPLGTKPAGDVSSPIIDLLKQKFRNWLE